MAVADSRHQYWTVYVTLLHCICDACLSVSISSVVQWLRRLWISEIKAPGCTTL